MASSKSKDEDSFSARVHKIFGSLPSSSSSAPSWFLTDDKVEKKEWGIRSKDPSNRDDETPCSSSFDGIFRKVGQESVRSLREELEDDLDDLSDDEHCEIGPSKESFCRTGDDDEKHKWEIRSSIGLDCTLDKEEEEDEYDKIAEGSEHNGDRLYTRDITGKGSSLSTHNGVWSSTPDPRANHLAARFRPKEDDAGTEKLDSYKKLVANNKSACDKASKDSSVPKPILKRQDDAAAKPSKRVKFDLSCSDKFDKTLEEGEVMIDASPAETYSLNKTLVPEDEDRTDTYLVEIDASDAETRNNIQVPDYLVNPSKYTRYSFSSSCRTNHGSSLTCMEYLEPQENSKVVSKECESVHLPTSVAFIPRAKANDTERDITGVEITNDLEDRVRARTGLVVRVAVNEAEQSEEVMVGEDETETVITEGSKRFQKSGRCYRTKTSSEDLAS